MAENICEICSRGFGSEEALMHHKGAKHSLLDEEKSVVRSKKIKKYAVMGVIFLSFIILVYTFYLRAGQEGKYDNFVKCLAEKGAVIYGNDFCQYTSKQLNYFGKSKKYLNYVKCIDEKELCDSKGIKSTPTWEINGKMYEQVQTFEKLALFSGCSI